MIHRAEQKGDVVAVVGEAAKVAGVPLLHRDRFTGLGKRLKDLDIVRDQLHRINGIALLREVMRIAPRPGADLADACAGCKVTLDIANGGEKFHRAVPRTEAGMLIVGGVVGVEIIIDLHNDLLKNTKAVQAETKPVPLLC